MSTFRVAISGDLLAADGSPAFPGFDFSRLAAADVEIAFVGRGPVLTAAELEGFDALILFAPRLGADSVPAGGRLALVARCGVGTDTVDIAACTDNAIALVITPDAVRRPVAVMVVTFMLALAGNLLPLDRITRAGPWRRRTDYIGTGLEGRVFGQIGIGNIGAEVLRLVPTFGLQIIGHDPYVAPEEMAALGVRMVDLETIFRDSDVLSISCPLTDETRGLVNGERLALMKRSAFLINTSRGPVVDQAALADALARRVIAGAGLDVLMSEPPDAADPILGLDNVILTPHAMCWTDQLFATMSEGVVQACLDVRRGVAPANVVNRDVLDGERFRSRLAAYAKAFAG